MCGEIEVLGMDNLARGSTFQPGVIDRPIDAGPDAIKRSTADELELHSGGNCLLKHGQLQD